MSTEIENPALPEGFSLTQFWGGAERGICVQINGAQVAPWGNIQLTPAQARGIALALMEWAASRGDTQAQIHYGRKLLAELPELKPIKAPDEV